MTLFIAFLGGCMFNRSKQPDKSSTRPVAVNIRTDPAHFSRCRLNALVPCSTEAEVNRVNYFIDSIIQ